MLIFKQAEALSGYIHEQQKKGIQVGFVPTMGALHEGHLSLIREAQNGNDLVICSIFVNPTQFNNAEDFEKYPVTIEKDIDLLEGEGCSALFLPSVQEIYPPGFAAMHYELGSLENVLEGAFRPGHFQGVCQVVDRLMQTVHPTRLYLGQKDFQQCMVIRRLLEIRQIPAELVICPTIREDNGLAMSSRNLRLSATERELALTISRILQKIRHEFRTRSIQLLKKEAVQELEGHGFQVDYVEVAHQHSLTPATEPAPGLVALIAATIGKVRLIDNLLLN